MKNLMTGTELLAWLWSFTHGAERTWAELVCALTGVNLERNDLETSAVEDAAIGHYMRLLVEMHNDGRARRKCSSDPRFDLWVPTSGRPASER